MLRKLVSLLFCVIFLVSLVACGDSEPVTSQDGADPSTDTVSSDTSSERTDTQTSTDTESKNTSTQKSPAQAILEEGQYFVGLTDQKNQRLLVCDLAVEDWSKDKGVVWKMKTYGGVAGIKFRDNEYWGGKVVIYCSGTQATIASYDKKRVLLSVTNAPVNSHSVELLPNGVFVVAGSTGNEVRIYGAGKKNYSDSVAFPSAHGVLWDPKYDVLWIEGSNLLQAYKVTGTVDAPKLTPVEDMRYSPNTNLHDMAPVYGNPDQLLLTGSAGVVLFDKTTGKGSYDYPAGGFLKTQGYVPGVGNYTSGVCVFTTIRSDTLTYKEWGTDKVGIFVPVEGTKGKVIYRQAKSDAYYKARVFSFDYQ
ncbi:MAG: hypothetical protein IJC19_02540 [Clostridia bacterium]|nr:hypothetical protein [Clostridia bacterium]